VASEYNQAKDKLEAALLDFQQACATDHMFEAGVRDLVDTLQPYHLDFGAGSNKTVLKNRYLGTRSYDGRG
jgi:hypothetical protein